MRSDDAHFLEVAAALGRQLTDSAIWYRGRCSWIGATLPEPGISRARSALGPDLYGGTSGVALFLAEAAVTLRDDRLRASALGAIRHALHHALPSRDGLYGGAIGVAYAAARVGRLLEVETAARGAGELLRAWRRRRTPSSAFDMVDGGAGTVAGLVALASLVEERWVVDAATRVGDALIAQAESPRSGWSWPSPGQRQMHNLCGFAHGAAGAGHALIELFAVTGDERFRRAGERAFDYEQSWIRSDTGACPDLRGVARTAPRSAPVPAAASWCYGASGIALSRKRAAELLGVGRADGELALAATRRFVSERLAYAPDDFCLCHGLAGAADVLLYADRESGLAADVGRLGIERHHRTGAGFPSGLPEGDTPGLFAGLAGVAMFYLRLGDRSVPTPLLINRLDRAAWRA
jgi:lantibiotic modifying enzyme